MLKLVTLFRFKLWLYLLSITLLQFSIFYRSVYIIKRAPDSRHSQRGFIFCGLFGLYLEERWMAWGNRAEHCVYLVLHTHTWNGSKEMREEMDELTYRMHDSCEHAHFCHSTASVILHYSAIGELEAVSILLQRTFNVRPLCERAKQWAPIENRIVRKMACE